MADTPFGLSFGDPRRYMGSSEIGSAIKKGLTAYALKQSGFTDWLDELKTKSSSGGQKPVIPGAAAPQPKTSAPEVSPFAPIAPPINNQQMQPMPAQGATGKPQVNVTPVAPPSVVTPMLPPRSTPNPPSTPTPPPSLGLDILDDKLTEFVNPKAQNDMDVDFSNPYRPMLTGNEYQEQPGYGRLMQFMKFSSGMMT